MHAEKCLICKGRGKVNDGENYGITRYGPGFNICYGCQGKGWVPVPDEVLPPELWPAKAISGFKTWISKAITAAEVQEEYFRN